MKNHLFSKLSPALVLLFMAPVLGELVSGHQYLLEFLNPLNFMLTALPYGLGALICRELTIRWNKGRLSLLLMGAAYGFFEEGVVIRSLTNTDWSELGGIGPYNQWAGVNWIYGFMMIHFHIVISIASSVLITEILFHQKRQERWLSNKMLAVCGIGLALWIPAGFLIMSPGLPPVHLYVLSILIMFTFVFAARRVPKHPFKKVDWTVRKPVFFFVLGFVNMLLIFLATFYEGAKPPMFIMFAAMAFLDILSFFLILRWSANGYGWTDRHVIALIGGGLLFFIVVASLQDIGEGFHGYSLVSAASAFALIMIYRSAKETPLDGRSFRKDTKN